MLVDININHSKVDEVSLVILYTCIVVKKGLKCFDVPSLSNPNDETNCIQK